MELITKPAGVAEYVPANTAVGVTFALPEHNVLEGYVNEASSIGAAVTFIGADKGPRHPLLLVTCAVYAPVTVAVIEEVVAPATGVVPLNHWKVPVCVAFNTTLPVGQIAVDPTAVITGVDAGKLKVAV